MYIVTVASVVNTWFT